MQVAALDRACFRVQHQHRSTRPGGCGRPRVLLRVLPPSPNARCAGQAKPLKGCGRCWERSVDPSSAFNVHLCRAGDASNTRSKYVVTLCNVCGSEVVGAAARHMSSHACARHRRAFETPHEPTGLRTSQSGRPGTTAAPTRDACTT